MERQVSYPLYKPIWIFLRKVGCTVLLDLFLATTEQYRTPESDNRKASMALALDLIGRNTKLRGYNFENLFRASAYTTMLASGASWDVHPSLRRIQRGWAIYEQNDLHSAALD